MSAIARSLYLLLRGRRHRDTFFELLADALYAMRARYDDELATVIIAFYQSRLAMLKAYSRFHDALL